VLNVRAARLNLHALPEELQGLFWLAHVRKQRSAGAHDQCSCMYAPGRGQSARCGQVARGTDGDWCMRTRKRREATRLWAQLAAPPHSKSTLHPP
jgi:hypothetical protein